MILRTIGVALVCCGVATASIAGASKSGKDEAQSMSEPNPVKAYVNVLPQGGDGKASTFILCEHSENGCKKPVHTKKHLAVSNQTVKVHLDTANESNKP